MIEMIAPSVDFSTVRSRRDYQQKCKDYVAEVLKSYRVRINYQRDLDFKPISVLVTIKSKDRKDRLKDEFALIGASFLNPKDQFHKSIGLYMAMSRAFRGDNIFKNIPVSDFSYLSWFVFQQSNFARLDPRAISPS
jgi:hypothetical protein